jgi:hypothetical protein
VIIAPLLLSSERDVKIFGALVTVVVVTYSFFSFAYISVFCFGGALMSLYLVWRPFSNAPADRRISGPELALNPVP